MSSTVMPLLAAEQALGSPPRSFLAPDLRQFGDFVDFGLLFDADLPGVPDVADVVVEGPRWVRRVTRLDVEEVAAQFGGERIGAVREQQRPPRRPEPESGAAAAASSGASARARTKPWPGSKTCQPKPPSPKRAKAIAPATGSAPLIRVTLVPSASTSFSTLPEIAEPGPRA